MNKKRVPGLLLFFVLLPAALQAQFARTYGGRYSDYNAWILTTAGDGFVVCGSSRSFDGTGPWLLKLAPDGTVGWEKAYIPAGAAYLTAICPAEGGGYAFLGMDDSNHAWVIRTDGIGEPVWQVSLTWPGLVSVHEICQGPESGFYIVGYGGPYPNTDLWIARLSAGGEVVWQKAYDLGGAESGGGAEAVDGDLIVACAQTDMEGMNGKTLILEIDALGAVSRQTSLLSDNVMLTEVQSIRAAAGGGYLAAGSEFVLKLGEGLGVEWAKVYSSAYLSDIRPAADGGSIATGTSGSHIVVLKLGAAGDIEWQKIYGGYFEETGTSVVQTALGDYAACGTTSSFGAGREDICVLRMPEGGGIGACGFSRGITIVPTEGAVGSADIGVTASDTAATLEAGGFVAVTTAGRSKTFRLCTANKVLTISSNLPQAAESWTSPALGSRVYLPGATVAIYATASPTLGGTTYNFSSWDGDVVTVSNPVNVTMDDDMSVRAYFYEEWPDPDDDTHTSIDECFVATAAYRTPLHPTVKMLREFRDRRLLTNGLGRAFVEAYYRWSPPAARVIAGSPVLRLAARALLVPFIAVAFVVLKLGWVLTFLLSAALAYSALRLRNRGA